jgi:hypothetical protein
LLAPALNPIVGMKAMYDVRTDAALDFVVPAAWTVIGELRWASLTASSREIGCATESALA